MIATINPDLERGSHDVTNVQMSPNSAFSNGNVTQAAFVQQPQSFEF